MNILSDIHYRNLYCLLRTSFTSTNFYSNHLIQEYFDIVRLSLNQQLAVQLLEVWSNQQTIIQCQSLIQEWLQGTPPLENCPTMGCKMSQ